jgi:hypothetical protein
MSINSRFFKYIHQAGQRNSLERHPAIRKLFVMVFLAAVTTAVFTLIAPIPPVAADGTESCDMNGKSPSDLFGVAFTDSYFTNGPPTLPPVLFRMDTEGNVILSRPLPFLNGLVLEWGPASLDRNISEDALYFTPYNASHTLYLINGRPQLIKYDACGSEEWTIAVPIISNVNSWQGSHIGVSANPVLGGAYVTSYSDGVFRVDSSGNVLWGPLNFGISGETAWNVATDVTTGGAFVTGYNSGVVMKIYPSGTELWRTSVAEAERVNANPIDGGVYIAAVGYSSNLYKFDANGVLQWSKYNYPSPYNYARGVSPLDGSIYIQSGWPFRFAEVASDGTELWNVDSSSEYPGYHIVSFNATVADLLDDAVYVWTQDKGIMKFFITGSSNNGELRAVWNTDPGFVSSDGTEGDSYALVVGMPGKKLCPNDPANDVDGDGICGNVDNCPNVANANQSDVDGDGIGDACEPDDDGDGVIDDYDNCPMDTNPDQADVDLDGIGDICDADDDNDGVVDGSDVCLNTPSDALVLSNGCSVDQQCPCDNPWKNHGAYVSCVAQSAGALLNDGKIDETTKDAIVSSAGQSSCGRL